MASVLEKIIGNLRRKQTAATIDYWKLVKRIGDNDEPTADQVQRSLAESGKTVEELAADVARYQERLALRAMADRLPEIAKERQAAHDVIAEANRLLEAAERKHRDTTAPHYDRIRQLDEEDRQATDARARLLEGTRDAQLRDQYYEVCAKREQAHHRVAKIEGTLASVKDRIAAHEGERDRIKKDPLHDDGIKGKAEERLQEAKARIFGERDAVAAELPVRRKELAALTEREAELERQILQP